MKIPIAKLIPESDDPCHTVYDFLVFGFYSSYVSVENNVLYLIKDFPHREYSYDFLVTMTDPMLKNEPIQKTYTISYKYIKDAVASDLIITTTPP